MLSKSGVFALVATLSAGAHALSLNAPSNVQSGQNITVTWSTSSGDEPFSLFLHHSTFNSDFAVANNVAPGPGSTTFGLPQVPAHSDYTLRATNITDISKLFSESPSFAISNATSTGTDAGSATGAGSGTATATNPPPTGSGSATGTGTGNRNATGSNSASRTSSGSSANSTSTNSNNGFSSGPSFGVMALAAAGAFAML